MPHIAEEFDYELYYDYDEEYVNIFPIQYVHISPNQYGLRFFWLYKYIKT